MKISTTNRFSFANVYRAKSFFLRRLLFSFFLVLFSYFSCEETTKPETVTFSGTVTLEGKQDRSDVKVMLFQPVAIDTALTNLNTRYPGIGIEINQRTEFYWREHNPSYQTTTNSAGAWKIEDVVPGQYHIVAQADSFGWKVVYNAGAGNNDLTLPRAIKWEGTYNQSVTVPTGSFVEIVGDATFSSGTQVVIEPGVIVEFQNNSTLELQGTLFCNGIKENEIYFVSEDTANSNRLWLTQSNNSIIDRSCFLHVNRGIYITTSDSIKILNSRFNNAQYAFELFNCSEIKIENDLITNMLDGIIENNSKSEYKKNYFYKINEIGIESLNSNNSIIKYNVIKNCIKWGIGINHDGYGYNRGYVEIYNNDLIDNRNHLSLGATCSAKANENNFIVEKTYAVKTSGYTLGDTLDFRNNYWNTFSTFEIAVKIFDKLDRLGGNPEGPIVDFNNYKPNAINWLSKIE